MQATLRPDGFLVLRGEPIRAAFGRGGVQQHKEEGDGTTPAATLPLRRVLYRADRVKPPSCVVPIEPLAPNDGWCDDPTHRDYNRMIQLPHDSRHEELWRTDGLYDLIGVLGWNDAPVERARGSAIFLHVARADYAPTDGCIALALVDLQRVLAAGLDEILVLPA